MKNGKKILAIIPARGGSKRVLNKNSRKLGKYPLIGWTLRDLAKSKYIDHAYVSTDSKDLQKIAEEYKIDSHPLRPEHLATDTASSADVVLDIIHNQKPGYDLIILLQPTSPFRNIEDVDKAIDFFFEKSATSVTSVCETESHPSWSSALPENKSMDEMIKNIQGKRSQELQTFYRLNGAIYIVDVKTFSEQKRFFASSNAFAYIMSRIKSIDIDTEEDLEFAQCLTEKFE